jgi:Cyclic nucleotide-binding domain/Major Facilitator Superfamily
MLWRGDSEEAAPFPTGRRKWSCYGAAVVGAARSVGLVARSARLRRLVLSYGLFIVSEYGVWIAMLVYAYRHGGATASGLVAVAQLVPAAVLAPFLSAAADRRPPVLLLVGGYAAQAVGMGVTAATIFLEGPPLAAYGGAVLAATAVVAIRPGQAPLVPALARSVEELTAANVALGWVENLSIVAAGALTALALKVADVTLVFAVGTAMALVAAVLVSPLRTLPVGSSDRNHPAVMREVVGGLRLLALTPGPRLLLLLLAAEWVVIGALDVLQVVLALDVLGLGQSGVGLLNTASGVGGVMAGGCAIALVGRRLGGPIMLAGTAMTAGLLLITVIPGVAAAVAMVVVIGAGRAVLDVASRTLMQRAVPPDALGKVFGVVEGLTMGGAAVGSLMTPLFVTAGGSSAALVAAACVLPLAALSGGRALFRLDAAATVPVVEISLLRSIRLFQELPVPALEGLAQALQRVDAPAGQVVIRQGEPGDRYYAIAAGELRVERDGHDLGTRSRGDGVGEIALLRDVPRTATLTTVGPATLYALSRAPFLAAVTGHSQTTRLAHQVTQERLTDIDPARDRKSPS